MHPYRCTHHFQQCLTKRFHFTSLSGTTRTDSVIGDEYVTSNHHRDFLFYLVCSFSFLSKSNSNMTILLTSYILCCNISSQGTGRLFIVTLLEVFHKVVCFCNFSYLCLSFRIKIQLFIIHLSVSRESILYLQGTTKFISIWKLFIISSDVIFSTMWVQRFLLFSVTAFVIL